MKEDAVSGGVGHPNCKHTWTLFWDYDQIQDEKYKKIGASVYTKTNTSKFLYMKINIYNICTVN